MRAAQEIERDKRQQFSRVLRKTAAILRAELMDEKKVESLFPTIQEAKVEEDESPAS